MTLVAERMDQLDPSLITLLSPSSGLRWRNCVGGGEVISWHHVRSLITLAGTSEAWTFIVITGRGPAGRFVQCCGDSTFGLAVEVGAGSSNSLVAPVGSARYPASLITHEAWPYYATTGELHSVDGARRSSTRG